MSRRIIRTAVVSWPLLASLTASASVVSDWNQITLAEVRVAKFGPPIVARALAIAHTCIYDAWSAYDSRAVGAVVGTSLRRPAAERTDANKAKAISYAAYGCLLNLFPAGATRLAIAMTARGYDPADTSTNTATPQGIGNSVATAVINSRRNDGSNQYGDLAAGAYADYTGYASRNLPLPFCDPLTLGPCIFNAVSPTSWQPLISNTGAVQKFIAPHWERVKPFALSSATQFDTRPDVAAGPNYLRSTANFLADVNSIIAYSAGLDAARKLVVEYWADGPDSELPPGHWGLFAQYVSQRDGNSIDKDAKMFFAMHNASFDGGIVAWHLKRKYDGVRPITGVRYFNQGLQITAWGGPGRPTESIAGEKWMPYNPGSNLTPAFPGYISGHSTFSSASAAALRSFTGSDNFGFSTVIQPNFGRVESGVPSVATTMTYPTFSAAATEAGLSRLYGGIHFADDNTIGQTLGNLIGQQAFAKAQFLYDGGLAVDTSSSQAYGSSQYLGWSHTVPARSNRLLLVGVSFRDGNQSAVNVTYGYQAMTRLGAQSSPGYSNRVELWYLLAPPAGTANVLVQLADSRPVAAGAISLTGVDQTTPFGAVRTAADNGQSACISLGNASATLAAAFVSANGDAKSITVPSSQVTAWNLQTGTAGGDIQSTGATAAVATGATLCQTLGAGKPWSMVGVPLKAAVAP